MIHRARPLLGTLVEIRAEADVETVSRAFEAIAKVHTLMSFQDPHSDVSRLNRDAARDAVAVHPWTWRVLRAAGWMHAHSNGAFDCRVGMRAHAATSPHDDVAWLPRWHVRFRQPMRVDLSGIAKGFAVDRAIGVLRLCGNRAQVNAGGDLRVFGDTGQTIAVRDPALPQNLLPLGRLGGGAVATSAPYFSGDATDWAVRDPATGCSPQGYRSVTVLAPTCLRADALTKVVWVAGLESAQPLLARLHAEAIVL